MKSKEVTTVTSNEEFVRLRIYDGELPADAGMRELLRLERAQHEATRRRLAEANDRIARLSGLTL
jgi:hypothetical protein